MPEFLPNRCPASVEIIFHVFNIYDYVFSHSVPAKHLLETMLPISCSINFKWLHGLHVENVHGLGYFVDEYHWANAAQLFRKLLWHYDEIVTADRRQFGVERVLIVVCTVLLFVRHQLFRGFFTAHDVVIDEINETNGMRPMPELEVYTMASFLTLNTRALLGCAVL